MTFFTLPRCFRIVIYKHVLSIKVRSAEGFVFLLVFKIYMSLNQLYECLLPNIWTSDIIFPNFHLLLSFQLDRLQLSQMWMLNFGTAMMQTMDNIQ
jgi:hypothetical protein